MDDIFFYKNDSDQNQNCIKIRFNKKNYYIHNFQHLLHKNNVENILRYGILSHNEAYKRGLIKQDISMKEIQDRREFKYIKDTNIKLHDCASLYFQVKNPMLFKRKDIQDDLVVLFVNPEVIYQPNVYFTDGNAGADKTRFYKEIDNLFFLDLELILKQKTWAVNEPYLGSEEVKIIQAETRRKRCAEVLVFPSIDIKYITQIICPNESSKYFISEIFLKNEFMNFSSKIEVVIDTNKKYFFNTLN
ncbi:MAG: hypothetical protein HW421_1229 [Ignavibacteria bacterium]|nr:hypothetical protein [Ignavibacteria bacterium]